MDQFQEFLLDNLGTSLLNLLAALLVLIVGYIVARLLAALTRRANGWPIAMLPPFTFSCARSIGPIGWFRPSLTRQNSSDCQAFRVAIVCAAKAS